MQGHGLGTDASIVKKLSYSIVKETETKLFMENNAMTKFTSREVNEAALSLKGTGGYEILIKKYQKMAADGAVKNKGFVFVDENDPIIMVIYSLRRNKELCQT